MSIQSVGMKAYSEALSSFASGNKKVQQSTASEEKTTTSFMETVEASVKKVNDMQQEKSGMIESFASGEQQNVHELMITLQKASVAMNLTSAVRNKVLNAYNEISKMQF
ncbi:flagellar hook-basal body complex protein FliE [Halodesulfovibrio marinisediminis]|uniref:Flagellar hook-basal body complex protein FliE n=1 Tax=Halodesulfovibrio marinisediminis DSM 17456 TaxID=1121457 RepID=A0A1N6J6D3_9BACT|nr:flagellar hook-basal body complex protein FliE [Halodesulfovibrio marinisediminis]SIO39793.1 flagellar hook-basal body complex protein FliE [Halodesulfovibrio marinisediminis DSM 17456]